MGSQIKIGKKLKKVREGQELTQEDLAEKAGISANYYAKVERDEINVTVNTLRKIVKALGIKSSDIMPF